MKHIFILFISIFLMNSAVHCNELKLTLKLHSSNKYIKKGETAKFSLSIGSLIKEDFYQAGIQNIDTVKVQKSIFNKSPQIQFIHEFNLIFEELGPQRIGPFKLQYDNVQLTSNTLEVIVVKNPIQKHQFEVFVVPEFPQKGEEIFVTAHLKSKVSIENLKLNENIKSDPLYKLSNVTHSTKTSIINGVAEYTNSIDFKITCSQATIIIDKSWFVGSSLENETYSKDVYCQ